MPLPQFREEIFSKICNLHHRRNFREWICEQVLDVPVPQVEMLPALHFQVRATSHEIQGKCSDVESGKEEFFTQTHELTLQLYEMFLEDWRVVEAGICHQARER